MEDGYVRLCQFTLVLNQRTRLFTDDRDVRLCQVPFICNYGVRLLIDCVSAGFLEFLCLQEFGVSHACLVEPAVNPSRLVIHRLFAFMQLEVDPILLTTKCRNQVRVSGFTGTWFALFLPFI